MSSVPPANKRRKLAMIDAARHARNTQKEKNLARLANAHAQRYLTNTSTIQAARDGREEKRQKQAQLKNARKAGRAKQSQDAHRREKNHVAHILNGLNDLQTLLNKVGEKLDLLANESEIDTDTMYVFAIDALMFMFIPQNTIHFIVV